jgi:AraC-like DNA-binding protein
MGHVTSLFARKVAAACGGAFDTRELLKVVGIDPNSEWDPKVMIPETAYYEMWERIAQELDVTALPLKVGASMKCDEYGALGLAFKAARDLMGSFARVERYARLWTDVVEYELRPHPRGMLFILHRAGQRRLGLRMSNEATLASAVSISRQVCPVEFAPIEVHFKHEAPSTLDHHKAYFECDVMFNSDMDALLLSPEALAQPNKLGDEGITQFLLSHLDHELSEIDDTPLLERQTKDAISRALSEGLPKMADIARSLGMSARSFHRRLNEHGMSFKMLTEDTRRELAEGLLRDETYSLSEIAFLTGFSEQSAFTRAFKRWMGVTPAHYRKDQPGT